MTLYMFRTVFPSIISSSRLYIQQYLFGYNTKKLYVSTTEFIIT